MKKYFFSVLLATCSAFTTLSYSSAQAPSSSAPFFDQRVPGSANASKEDKLSIIEEMIKKHTQSLEKARADLAEDQEKYQALQQQSNWFSRAVPGTTKWMLGQYPQMIHDDEQAVSFHENSIKRLHEDKLALERQN